MNTFSRSRVYFWFNMKLLLLLLLLPLLLLLLLLVLNSVKLVSLFPELEEDDEGENH